MCSIHIIIKLLNTHDLHILHVNNVSQTSLDTILTKFLKIQSCHYIIHYYIYTYTHIYVCIRILHIYVYINIYSIWEPVIQSFSQHAIQISVRLQILWKISGWLQCLHVFIWIYCYLYLSLVLINETSFFTDWNLTRCECYGPNYMNPALCLTHPYEWHKSWKQYLNNFKVVHVHISFIFDWDGKNKLKLL